VRVGALVDSVTPGGPADHAGINGGDDELLFQGRRVVTGGDVVVAINGLPVASADDLVRIVSGRLEPGKIAAFTLVRDGSRRTVAVRLAERPDNPRTR
jgi:S1-C subfamily serine protease